MVPSFVTRKVASGRTLGERLQEARQANTRLSLDEISRHVGVPERYLQWLENDEYDRLPAPVYTRGFLKAYLDFLGLDPEEYLELFDKEKKIQDKIEKVHKVKANAFKPFKKVRLFITPGLIKLVVAVVIVSSVITYISVQFTSFAKAPELVLDKPDHDLEIQTDSIIFAGSTQPGNSLTINSQAVFVDPAGRFQETISLQEGINFIKVAARNDLDKETVISRQVVVTLPPGEKKTDTAAKPDNVQVEIKIENNPTWVEVKVDGQEVFQGTMLAGTSRQFTGQETVTLTSGKGGNTRVIYNGQDLGLVGQDDEVIRDLEFTRDLSVEGLLIN